MKTSDFIRKHEVCREGAEWALSISEDMADVWDALIEQGKYDWLMWTATQPGVFSDSTLRRLACRFVRETPLHDGRTVWDLLTDERSRMAVEVAERYVDGKATTGELAAAAHASLVAANAAYSDACSTHSDASADASAAAAFSAARAAAFATSYAAAHASYAYSSAYFAADVARAAACAAYEAACAAAHADADAERATYVAADAAQIKMIAALGNPFKKGASK